MGWNYAMCWLIILPLELSAAAIVVQYWQTNVSIAVFITIFLILIVLINLGGVRAYGEAESIFSMIKVIAIIGFMILAVCINVGASPAGKYLGAKTWSNPGAFHNGFHGLCGVFVNAAFSFSGTELIGLAAAEAANPRKTVPKATKQVFWRITLFYVLSLLLVGFIVPYNDPRLVKGTSKAAKSPFVIAIKIGGIKVLPSIFNAVILIAVLSVGNSATYGSSRTLAALAKAGQAPRFLGYVDRKGRPMAALALALLFGLLAYVNVSPDGHKIFDWLLAISSLSSFVSWASICLCHIRYRQAWKLQGHSLDEIPFRAAFGIYGSWFGFVFNILCLVATFYVAIWPVGRGGQKGTVEDFFLSYLAAPVFLIFFCGYKIANWKTCSFVRVSKMDVSTGRRSLDLAQIRAAELAEAEHPRSILKKIWDVVC
jgi:amino acid transporter